MRQKLAEMSDVAKENLVSSQQRQKQWYDRKARERTFKEGDRVLVLLPTEASKLLAQWQGPFMIKKKVGDIDYEVELTVHRKNCRIFHAIVLRKWYAPLATSLLADELPNEEEDIVTWKEATEGARPVIGKNLTVQQMEVLRTLMMSFADVINDTPGRTSMVEHHIVTKVTI